MPKGPFADSPYTSNDPLLVADMHKAIAVILFKLEGQLVSRNPNFNMSDRRLLDKIDFENATVTVGERSIRFPTPSSPQLTMTIHMN